MLTWTRRIPENNPLRGLVAEHGEEFLATAFNGGAPRFIRTAMARFLECGKDLVWGKLHCRDCNIFVPIAKSCKARQICFSCTRRVALATSKQWIERLFPRVPFRHWVISYPLELNLKLANRPEMISKVEAAVGKVLRKWTERGTRKVMTGGIMVRHRYGSRLQVLIHTHVLMADGCIDRYPPDELKNDGLDERDMAHIAGKLFDSPPFIRSQNLNLESLKEIAADLHATLEKIAKKEGINLSKSTSDSEPDLPPTGFATRHKGLHLAVSHPIEDGEDLERVCQYLLRPAINPHRVRKVNDDEYTYLLDKKLDSGEKTLRFHPHDLLKIIASIIPKGGMPTRRYFGFLAATSPYRKVLHTFGRYGSPPPTRTHVSTGNGYSDIPFPELLKETFGIDARACPVCGKCMKFWQPPPQPKAVDERATSPPPGG
jgi:hypothetical protein